MLPLRRHLPCSCEAVNSPAPPLQQRPDYSEWTSDPGLHTLFSWWPTSQGNSDLNDGNHVLKTLELLAVARNKWQLFSESSRGYQQIGKPPPRLPPPGRQLRRGSGRMPAQPFDVEWHWVEGGLGSRAYSAAPPTDSADVAGSATLRSSSWDVCGLSSLGAFGRQLGKRSFDVAPDAAQGDTKHALAAAQQVDHLIVGGALEDRHAVAHQRHLGQILDAAGSQMLNGGTDLLQRDTRIDQPFDDLQDQDVAEAIQALGTGSGCAANLRHDQAGTRPVVELPVGDARRAAGDWSAEAKVDRQRREVAVEQQPLRLRRLSVR